jgi:hypothetical protein
MKLIQTSLGEIYVTDRRPDISLGRPDDQMGIRLLLNCNLHRIFVESGNYLLDACDTDTCHIKAFHS